MPDFNLMFSKTDKWTLNYKNKILRQSEFIPVKKGDEFCVTFEKFKSEWRQGIHVSVMDRRGKIKIFDHLIKHGIHLWQNTAPKKVIFEVIPKGAKDFLRIWNIWDTGNGVVEAKTYGAAMIREDIENGARYYCNDGHPDDNFDDIVFTLVKTKGVWETPLEKSPLRK